MDLQRVLNARSGLTPLELITKERSDYREILRCHVWGCPVYVLEAKLQNDQKLPKWNRRARLGQFVGFLDEHSSMVANVRHLTTGYISPQFHVVFDDLFETVNRTGVDEQAVESVCNGLFQRNRELYAEDELNEVGNLIYQPMKFGLVLILAGAVCVVWDFFLVQVYARVDLYLFSTVT